MFLELILMVISIGLFLVYRKRRYEFGLFERLGIPGPRPSFWTGNLHEIRNNETNPLEVMTIWQNTYGKIYGYFAGQRPMLVAGETSHISEILVKSSSKCLNRPELVVETEPVAQTLVGLRGQRWKAVRALLAPIFSSGKMKRMAPDASICVQTTLNILENSGGTVVDAAKIFQGLTCNVIAKCALAMEVNSQEDDTDKFYSAVRGFLKTAVSAWVKIALCWPIMGKFMHWGGKLFGYEHEMTRMIIQSVKNVLHNRDTSKEYTDVLELMRKSGGLSEEEIIANAWVFILGGFETTAAALSFTSYLLSEHPQIQEKLWKEIDQAVKDSEIPSYDTLRSLKYLDQVISESLRLYPPVATFMSRQLEEPMNFGGIEVPSGINVQIPLWQIHHDEELWEDAETFDPDRFADGNKGPSMAYLPFGGGPRSCIGMPFALMEIKVALAAILKRFRIVPGGTGRIKIVVPTVSIVPENGIPLKFIPRK